MATLNTYHDAYLSRHCSEDRETRAYADVDDIATFAQEWRDKLAVIRCYVIVCLECQGEPDDLYGVKLKHYRSEFDAVLSQAKAATTDAGGMPIPVFSVPILRG